MNKLSAFSDWLDIADDSRRSYCSYVKSLFANVLEHKKRELATIFPIQSEDICSVFNWCVSPERSEEELSAFSLYVEELLGKEIRNAKKGVCTFGVCWKTLTNFRSGFRSFMEFLGIEREYDRSYNRQSEEEEKTDKPRQSSIISQLGFHPDTLVFTHKQMYRTFKSRLKTQDRFFENIIYPIRLLSKVFNDFGKDAEYNDLLESIIEQIKFKVSTESIIVDFNNIKSLRIDFTDEESSCSVNSGKDKKLVYTEYFENGQCTGVRPITPTSFRDISLDHDTPMHSLLEDNLQKYPALKELSDDIGCFYHSVDNYNDLRQYRNDICRNYYEQHIFTQEEVENLFIDFKNLHKEISLTIMDCKENSRKNDT